MSIGSVSFLLNTSILGTFASTGTIALPVGNVVLEVDFRGDEKAKHCHDAILSHMLNVK